MKFLIDLLRLVRAGNLLILLLTQAFAWYFLNPSSHPYDLLHSEFIRIVLSTLLVAGAGYIINDYMDVKLDLVNKPEKVIVGQTISRRMAMLLHFVMNSTALLLAFSLGKTIAFAVAACVVALWFYSQALKKTYLSGNLLVSLLTASTLWVLYLLNDHLMFSGVVVYALFAFMSSLIREIIKDAEDLRGDQKFKCRTLPIVLGIRKTREILFWLQLSLMALTGAYVSFFPALSLSSNQVYISFLVYMAALVLLPMAGQAWLIRTADVKKDFSRLSTYSKIIMVFGILSMVFWKL